MHTTKNVTDTTRNPAAATAPTTRRAGNLPPDATPGEIAAARRRQRRQGKAEAAEARRAQDPAGE